MASIKTLNKITDCSADLVYSIDTEGKLTWVNQASTRILGYTPSQLVGRVFTDFLHEEERVMWHETTSQAVSGGCFDDLNNRFLNCEGDEINLTTSIIWDSKDECVYCVSKEAFNESNSSIELKNSEEKYRILFDLSPIPKHVYDLRTLKILDVNQAAIDHYGYSREEFLSMGIQDLRPESEVPNLMKAIEKYKSNEGVIRFGTFKHRKKDGSIVDMDISGQKFQFADQTRVMVVCHDVTQQIELQKLLDEVTDLAKIGGWEIDLKDDSIYWSPMTRKLFEVDSSYNPSLSGGFEFYTDEGDMVEIQKTLFDCNKWDFKEENFYHIMH